MRQQYLDFEESRTERRPLVDELQEADLGIPLRHVQVLVVQLHNLLQTAQISVNVYLLST